MRIVPILRFHRLFGAGITIVGVLVGALTAVTAGSVTPTEVAMLAVAAILAHAWVGGLHEYLHRAEDRGNHAYAYKPAVNGDLSTGEMETAVVVVALLSVFSTAFLFGEWAVGVLLLGQLFAAVYAVWGKYRPVAYDVLPSVAAGLTVLFGAVAVGIPTPLTWVAVVCAFFICVYGQWINGLKDASADALAGAGSVAVLEGFNPAAGLSVRSWTFFELVLATFLLDAVYLMPAVFGWLSPLYTYPFFVVVLPLQVALVGHVTRPAVNYRLHGVAFVTLSLLMAVLLLWDRIGLWSLGLFGLAVGWHLSLEAAGAGFSHGDGLLSRLGRAQRSRRPAPSKDSG